MDYSMNLTEIRSIPWGINEFEAIFEMVLGINQGTEVGGLF